MSDTTRAVRLTNLIAEVAHCPKCPGCTYHMVTAAEIDDLRLIAEQARHIEELEKEADGYRADASALQDISARRQRIIDSLREDNHKLKLHARVVAP